MTAPISVLVVEDERALAQIVTEYLTQAGFKVTQVHSGQKALAVARDADPDLVLLDLGLPGLDGLEVCRQVRTFSDCYIIMLTARDDEVDKLVGLRVGADDYITKPFSPRELVARVQAAVRRPRISKISQPKITALATGEFLQFGALTIDLAAREITLCNKSVLLTRTEFDLLAIVAQAPRRAFS
jgi:DNA-binding response OmpR family regulator